MVGWDGWGRSLYGGVGLVGWVGHCRVGLVFLAYNG